MSVDRKQAQNIASVLSEGLPYIQRFYGKTIVINSWNKNCSTCAAQNKILAQAIEDFENVEFLFHGMILIQLN